MLLLVYRLPVSLQQGKLRFSRYSAWGEECLKDDAITSNDVGPIVTSKEVLGMDGLAPGQRRMR